MSIDSSEQIKTYAKKSLYALFIPLVFAISGGVSYISNFDYQFTTLIMSAMIITIVITLFQSSRFLHALKIKGDEVRSAYLVNQKKLFFINIASPLFLTLVIIAIKAQEIAANAGMLYLSITTFLSVFVVFDKIRRSPIFSK